MTRFAFSLLLIGTFGLTGLSLTACAPDASESTPLPAQVGFEDLIPDTPLASADGTKVWTISVEGMSCQNNCAPKVHDAIVDLDGIQEVHVSHADGLAWIRVPDDTDLTVEDVVEAVNSTDSFTATIPGTQS